jgi:hypothetical protein
MFIDVMDTTSMIPKLASGFGRHLADAHNGVSRMEEIEVTPTADTNVFYTMEDETVASLAQNLGDLELAALLCLIANQHCIIKTDRSTLDTLEQELKLVNTMVLWADYIHRLMNSRLPRMSLALYQ